MAKLSEALKKHVRDTFNAKPDVPENLKANSTDAEYQKVIDTKIASGELTDAKVKELAAQP